MMSNRCDMPCGHPKFINFAAPELLHGSGGIGLTVLH